MIDASLDPAVYLHLTQERGWQIMASLDEVRAATPRLAQTEAEFVAGLTAVRPATPPNHQTIVQLNQAGAALPDDLITLEAGANRCAIA